MPSLTEMADLEPIKMLLYGRSGVGKTGSLASLAAAGYQLRIIDTDNGLPVLRNLILHPKSPYPPACLANIQAVTFTDSMRTANGNIVPAQARAWSQAVAMLDRWKDGAMDLGPVKNWGHTDILVLDTLSSLTTAALNFIQALNGRLGEGTSGFKGQRDIGETQARIESLLQMLSDRAIKCNVIVMAHIVFSTELGGRPRAQTDDKGQVVGVDDYSGLPATIGRALGPKIPQYFNTALELRTVGEGPGARKWLYTKTQGPTELKNTTPFGVEDRYPIATGLADYFKAVHGPLPKEPKP